MVVDLLSRDLRSRRVTPKPALALCTLHPLKLTTSEADVFATRGCRMTARSVERLVTHVGARGQVRKTSPSSTKPPGSDV